VHETADDLVKLSVEFLLLGLFYVIVLTDYVQLSDSLYVCIVMGRKRKETISLELITHFLLGLGPLLRFWLLLSQLVRFPSGKLVLDCWLSQTRGHYHSLPRRKVNGKKKRKITSSASS